MNMPSSSGWHGERSAAGPSSTSKPMTSQSGLRQRGAAVVSDLAAAGSICRPNTTTSGLADERCEFSSGVDEMVPAPKEGTPKNPWNQFQRDHKGKGPSKKTMSQIYQYKKSKKGSL